MVPIKFKFKSLAQDRSTIVMRRVSSRGRSKVGTMGYGICYFHLLDC
ncbi:hypothetical protein ACHAWT_009285 [Skeletonema menzelii]